MHLAWLLTIVLAQGDYTRTVDRSVPIGNEQALVIEHSMGNVDVTLGKGREIRVVAQIEAKGDQARAFGDQIDVIAADEGGRLTLRTRYPNGTWKDLSYSVALCVQVPDRHAVDLESAFGHATMSGLRDGVTARTSNGGLDVVRCGGTVELTNAFGDLTVAECEGAMRVTSTSGSVTMRSTTASEARVTASFGRVELRDIQGPLHLEAGNGDCSLANVKGDVHASTQFGNTTYRDITGTLDITNTNGDASITQVAGAVRMRSSFGKIAVADAKLGVQLDCSNGDVRVTDVKGAFAGKCSFGAMRLERIGGDCRVDGANGDLVVRDVRGRVAVDRSFGSVHVANADQSVAIEGHNGAITLEGWRYRSPGGEGNLIALDAQFGTIDIALPEPLALKLDARTTFGAIHSSLPLPGLEHGDSSDECHCTLGEPVATVRLTTQNGDIRIHKAHAASIEDAR